MRLPPRMAGCSARTLPRHSGFALVPALFLLVVLGALALVAIRIGTGQQQAVTMGLLQARAMAAARSGVEWGASRALAAAGGSCAANTTLNLSEAALSGFAVSVSCKSSAFANGAATSHSYTITSTAIYGQYGNPGYVRRVVSATFTDAT